jgi:glyoxylase-like metal-dependent hydrolase (beta-lactamase superfamily II)
MEKKVDYPRRKVALVEDLVYAYLADEAAHPQANIGLIETPQGVIFIDSNTYHAVDFVAEMRSANKTIQFMVHTHSHWDHVTGNSLFSQDGALIVALDACNTNMQELGQAGYMERMKQLTPDRIPVPVKYPDITFSESLTIRMGDLDIQLLFFGPSHTNDSIAVFLPQHGILFTGDIMNYLNHCVLKQYSHPDPAHWPLVLDRLYQLPVRVAVPGHGPLTDREGLKIFRDYLVTFRKRVADMMANGKPLDQIKKTLDLSEYSSWRHQDMLPEAIENMYLSLGGET